MLFNMINSYAKMFTFKDNTMLFSRMKNLKILNHEKYSELCGKTN